MAYLLDMLDLVICARVSIGKFHTMLEADKAKIRKKDKSGRDFCS
jgi:hypothetical protein